MRVFKGLLTLIVAVTLWTVNAHATAIPKLTRLSLEELMSLKIITVGKTPQILSKAPVAAFVLSNEDIHRSGATTIPDLLRKVPGVQVASIDSNTWAVSLRGFNDRFTKTLLLIDGRSVFDPVIGGVLWNFHDTVFEDIERIEVVLGPGATSWGTTSSNGAISIITKSAKNTQGFYGSGGYGSKENGFGELRYGARAGDNLYYRIYTKYFDRDNSTDGNDDWASGKFGGRADWDIDPDNHLTIQGDSFNTGPYDGRYGQTIERFLSPSPFGTPAFRGPYSAIQNADLHGRGTNVLGRYTHQFSSSSDLTLQAYYDGVYVDDPFIAYSEGMYDVDALLRFPIQWVFSQEWLLGAGYRYTADKTRGSFEISMDPPNRVLELGRWSVQDEIRLRENFMTAWLGSAFEYNNDTGFEYQPSARLAIYPDSQNTIWGAVTRTARTPSINEEDLRANIVRGVSLGPVLGTGPLLISENGSKDFKTRTALSYETGLKSRMTKELNVDISAFYNEYRNLRTVRLGRSSTPAPSFITTLPAIFGNDMSIETYGVETWVKYQLTPNVSLTGGYNYLKIKSHTDPDVNVDQSMTKSVEGESPKHQASGGVSLDLPGDITFDALVRYVGPLLSASENIESYVSTDLRLAWKPNENVELSVVGLNLFEAGHLEFIEPAGFDFLGKSTRTEPSVYGEIEVKF